jgi:hypothetical protein
MTLAVAVVEVVDGALAVEEHGGLDDAQSQEVPHERHVVLCAVDADGDVMQALDVAVQLVHRTLSFSGDAGAPVVDGVEPPPQIQS